MRSAVIFVLLVSTFVLATVAERPNPFDKVRQKFDGLDDATKKYFCNLCTDVVEATEQYIGEEGVGLPLFRSLYRGIYIGDLRTVAWTE